MKRTRQRQGPRHIAHPPPGSIVQPQPVKRKSAATRRVRFLDQPIRHDALNQRFYLRIIAFRGCHRIGYGRSEKAARQCGCQQDHAEASLRSGAIEDGGPVEVRMRPDESCEIARPVDAPRQVLASVDRQSEKVILRRQGRHGPATQGRGSGPAPQSGIVDVQCHIHRHQPRVKLDADPEALL